VQFYHSPSKKSYRNNTVATRFTYDTLYSLNLEMQD